MNVFVIGETDSIFLEEIIGLSEGAGHRVRVATIGVPIARDERLRFDELNDLYADADMVVEAFIRNPSEIETVISELDARLPPGTVILAATHAASATQL